jgi:glutamine synthetase
VEGDASERGDLPPLPRSLESALAAFDTDVALRGALGHEFSEYYAASRRWELEQWQQTVSEWERERYGGTV